jgi:hypothetical protein
MKFISICPVILCLFFLVSVAGASPQDGTCDLPPDLQQRVDAKYPGSKLVRLSNLDEHDRDLFQKEHGNACPGVVEIDFYGDGKPTLALVLLSRVADKETAQLVVAHKVSANWRTTLLDSANSSVPVVWSEDPGVFHDVDGKKSVRATKPVIVFCGYEAWAILYAWTDGRVVKIWLSD